MKLITTKFKSGELHEKHVALSKHLRLGTWKPRKSSVEMAGRRTFRKLTVSPYNVAVPNKPTGMETRSFGHLHLSMGAYMFTSTAASRFSKPLPKSFR